MRLLRNGLIIGRNHGFNPTVTAIRISKLEEVIALITSIAIELIHYQQFD